MSCKLSKRQHPQILVHECQRSGDLSRQTTVCFVVSCVSGRTQDGSRSTDAAHVDAMNVRNKQYQMLHGKYQKLMAEKAAKSQLASRQATEMHQLRVCSTPHPRIQDSLPSAFNSYDAHTALRMSLLCYLKHAGQ